MPNSTKPSCTAANFAGAATACGIIARISSIPIPRTPPSAQPMPPPITDAMVHPAVSRIHFAGRASTVATSSGSTGIGMMIDSRTANSSISRSARAVPAMRRTRSYCSRQRRHSDVMKAPSLDTGFPAVVGTRDMVRVGGLEPPSPCGRRILNPLRLPIPPHSHIVNVPSRRPRPRQPCAGRRVAVFRGAGHGSPRRRAPRPYRTDSPGRDR